MQQGLIHIYEGKKENGNRCGLVWRCVVQDMDFLWFTASF